MNIKELSKAYFDSTHFVGKASSDLYEELHDEAGNPITDMPKVMTILNKYSKAYKAELSGIHTALVEYNETNKKSL